MLHKLAMQSAQNTLLITGGVLPTVASRGEGKYGKYRVQKLTACYRYKQAYQLLGQQRETFQMKKKN
jgi:hypothetical protein